MLQAVVLDKTHKVDQENFLRQDNSQADKVLTLVVDLEEAYRAFQKEEHPLV